MGELLLSALEPARIEVVWIDGSRPEPTGMRPRHA
jgi:hypothetical protein